MQVRFLGKQNLSVTHGNFFTAKRLLLLEKEKVKKAELCCG